MCGRYFTPAESEIERCWHIGRHNYDPFGRLFNVAPTTQIPLLRLRPGAGELELAMARWGLIPFWWKKPKPPGFTFNTRIEDKHETTNHANPRNHGVRSCFLRA